jgi:hypothetical protein
MFINCDCGITRSLMRGNLFSVRNCSDLGLFKALRARPRPMCLLQRERCLLVIIHDDADSRVDRTVCLVRRAQGPRWCLGNDFTYIRHPEQRGSRPIAGRCAINLSRSIIATSPVAGNGRPRQRRGIYQLLHVHGPLVARLREALCHSSRRLSPVFIRLALRRDPCIPVSRLVRPTYPVEGAGDEGGVLGCRMSGAHYYKLVREVLHRPTHRRMLTPNVRLELSSDTERYNVMQPRVTAVLRRQNPTSKNLTGFR